MAKIFGLTHLKEGGHPEMLTHDQWTTIHVLKKQGWGIRPLARELGLARNTIRLALAKSPWTPGRRSQRQTVLTPFAASLAEKAATVGYNAQRIYQDLVEQGYTGSYQQVKRAIRPLRDEATRTWTVRFDTAPGHQGQVDWGSTLVWLGEKRVRVHVFLMVLGYSRLLTGTFTLDETQPTFLACHEQAFAELGGMPTHLLYDNPKTVVLRRDAEGRVLEWNPVLKDFLSYWGVEPKACQPYRAQTKGKVEAGIKYVKRNFLPGRRFTSLADLNAQFTQWRATVANRRIHGTTHEPPVARVQEEQPQLLPWGTRPPYQLLTPVRRRVATDALVDWATNRYSVPAAWVGHVVEVADGPAQTVTISAKGHLIACHQRVEGRYHRVVLPGHWTSSPPKPHRPERPAAPTVHIRPLACYEEVLHG